jgi:putative oxidoreductase
MRYLDRLQPLALLVMRLSLGVIMVVHGYHKVFGGLHHHAQVVAGLGLPAWLGYVSSFTELLGGLLLLAGLFTRAAAFAVCIDLVVAIWKVHFHNGLIGSPDHPGYEFALSVAALAFALIFFGGGPIAIDHALRGVEAAFPSDPEAAPVADCATYFILRGFASVILPSALDRCPPPQSAWALPGLNSRAVETMMVTSPMQLHPNGLAAAS